MTSLRALCLWIRALLFLQDRHEFPNNQLLSRKGIDALNKE
jgi:hypothetical protein